MEKLINAKEILDKRFGEIGTGSREKFREESFSFYFGEIIKNRRKELRLSQNDLAELIGKKRPYISRIENGEDIRLSNFALIANALKLSIHLVAK
jgi:ribosome-binding protein aMBF1 (putative translation factor)